MQINLDVLNFNIILMNKSIFGASYKMENIGNTPTGDGVHALPKGVVQCEGIPRKSRMTKCFSLMNEAGVLVAKGICQNVSSDLIIDSNNRLLRDDYVAVQIVESLSKNEIPSSHWVFQLRLWHIKRDILNGVSLYDHEQMNIFNLASATSRWCSRVDACPYKSSQERGNFDKILKKVALLVNRVNSTFGISYRVLKLFGSSMNSRQ